MREAARRLGCAASLSKIFAKLGKFSLAKQEKVKYNIGAWAVREYSLILNGYAIQNSICPKSF